MGCGCKKKKSQAGVTPAASRATRAAIPQSPPTGAAETVQEGKDYQTKVRDALRQLMDMKKQKRNLRK